MDWRVNEKGITNTKTHKSTNATQRRTHNLDYHCLFLLTSITFHIVLTSSLSFFLVAEYFKSQWKSNILWKALHWSPDLEFLTWSSYSKLYLISYVSPPLSSFAPKPSEPDEKYRPAAAWTEYDERGVIPDSPPIERETYRRSWDDGFLDWRARTCRLSQARRTWRRTNRLLRYWIVMFRRRNPDVVQLRTTWHSQE